MISCLLQDPVQAVVAADDDDSSMKERLIRVAYVWLYVLILVFLADFLTKWTHHQRAEKAAAAQVEEAAETEPAAKETVMDDAAASSPKGAAKVVITPAVSPVIVPAKENEESIYEEEEEDDSPAATTTTAPPQAPVFYEKNFAKDKTPMFSPPAQTEKASSAVTPGNNSSRSYYCPVRGCDFEVAFADRHNPPLTADGTAVCDQQRWGNKLTNHAVKMRNHYTAKHSEIPPTEWPAGFAYVRANKKRKTGSDAAATATAVGRTKKSRKSA